MLDSPLDVGVTVVLAGEMSLIVQLLETHDDRMETVCQDALRHKKAQSRGQKGMGNRTAIHMPTLRSVKKILQAGRTCAGCGC